MNNCIGHWFIISWIIITMVIALVVSNIMLRNNYREHILGASSSIVGLVGNIILSCVGGCIRCTIFIIVMWVIWAAVTACYSYLIYKKIKPDTKIVVVEKPVVEKAKQVSKPVAEKAEQAQKPVEVTQEGATLKESMAIAKSSVSVLKLSKAVIVKYLQDKYSNIIINTRENYTSTHLPLADTHYKMVDDKKVCFVYVYELDGGKVMLLVRIPNEKAVKGFMSKFTVVKSAFPKSTINWYTVIIDSKFTSNNEVYDILDEAYNEL